MKEISKKELHDILKAHPEGGVVFVPPDDQMVHISYKSDFGATCLEIDEYGEPYCYDWSIHEYKDDELFKLYEEKDIFELIKVLIFSLNKDREYRSALQKLRRVMNNDGNN